MAITSGKHFVRNSLVGAALGLSALGASVLYNSIHNDFDQTSRAVCQVSGANAATVPMKNYLIPPGGFAETFIEADRLFREGSEKLGHDVPDYLNASFLALTASIESKGGANSYTKGNSYIGLMGFSPSLQSGKSQLGDQAEHILKLLNVVKDQIPVLKGCKTITLDLIVDKDYFYDPMLQALFSLVTARKADQDLSRHKNYVTMPSDMKQAALYLHHNTPVVVKLAVDEFDSKEPLKRRVKKKHSKQADHLIELMDANGGLYPDKITPRGLFVNVLKLTKSDRDAVAAYDPSRPNDRQAEAQAITDFLRRNGKSL